MQIPFVGFLIRITMDIGLYNWNMIKWWLILVIKPSSANKQIINSVLNCPSKREDVNMFLFLIILQLLSVLVNE